MYELVLGCDALKEKLSKFIVDAIVWNINPYKYVDAPDNVIFIVELWQLNVVWLRLYANPVEYVKLVPDIVELIEMLFIVTTDVALISWNAPD